MKKAELRKLYLQKMRSLSEEEHLFKSKKISENFFASIDMTCFSTLHTFLPIVKNHEVNTWLIIDQAAELNPALKILIPKSDFKTFEMSTHIFTREMKMVMNDSGILEPEAEPHFNEQEIDVILLPLLAFDQRGFRVGYGKGFYDRFLARCRKDILKIGLSLFDAVEFIDDTDNNDVPLDLCITPNGVLKF